jgi:hypothetical protein
VAAAARNVLVAVIAQAPSFEGVPGCAGSLQAGINSVEADYAAALAAIPNGPAKTAGLLLGQASAAAILALRANDGSNTPFANPSYPQITAPGVWRFTPGVDFAVVPGSAVAAGVLRKEELPSELLRHIAALIEFYQHDLSAS